MAFDHTKCKISVLNAKTEFCEMTDRIWVNRKAGVYLSFRFLHDHTNVIVPLKPFLLANWNFIKRTDGRSRYR